MKRIILDCDPGIDDAAAIIMACKSPVLQVEAITTVSGNCPVETTSTNALKILELIGRQDIPVAKGMSEPMVRKPPQDPFSHGSDGLAGTALPAPSTQLDTRHGVDMIIELVKKYPREITIVCAGPLTNLAMAVKKAPEIVELAGPVIGISGAFGLNRYAFENATGDNPYSEWNVYYDPEATKIVYESGLDFTAIGLDVATHFDVDFSQQDLARLKESRLPEAAFLLKTIEFVRGNGFSSYCAIIDCMAVACAISPSLVTTITGRVGVETKDGLTLGATLLDRRHHHVWKQLPEIKVADSAKYSEVLRLILDLVLA